jgi:hypothetical protein
MHIQFTDEQLDTIKRHLRARADIDGDGSPVAMVLDHIEEHEREQASESAVKYREAAKAGYYDEGELEIDDGAMVSLGGDDGAYVMAWRWVTNEEAGIKDVYDLEAENENEGNAQA